MKKLLIYAIIFIAIVIIAYLSYINSDGYKYKLAEQRLAESLAKLNKIPRHYLFEGVYNFDGETSSIKSFKDKFGEYLTKFESTNLGEGEVSFKSDKIVILFQGIREEFILGNPTLITWMLGPQGTGYSFPIIQWRAYNINDNSCFFRFDSIDNQQRRTKLKNTYPSLTYIPICLVLDITEVIRNDQKGMKSTIEIGGINELGSWGLGFKCLPENRLFHDKIELSSLVYKYNNLVPNYLNAKYAQDVYNIEKLIY
jgi:hypothetical protein